MTHSYAAVVNSCVCVPRLVHVLQCVAVWCSVLHDSFIRGSSKILCLCAMTRSCIAAYCSVLRCVAVCCSVLQCVA